jgi:hypothetical protein
MRQTALLSFEGNIYHLFTETEGNSLVCGPETAVVARGEAEGNNGGREAAKHTVFPRSLFCYISVKV